MSIGEKRSKASQPATLKAHVGTLTDMGARFVDAWRRTERGEAVNESNVTFLDMESMIGTLSPRRLELLRKVRRHGGYSSIRAIADALKRDYKNVHDDVTTLVAVGLLVQEGRRITAPWSQVQASVSLG